MVFIISYKDKYLQYQTQYMIPTTETVLTSFSILCLPRPADSLHITIMGQLLWTCRCPKLPGDMVLPGTLLITEYPFSNWKKGNGKH